ncbi:MAG TPA: pilus assembly protein, partial [Hyphomicrobiaceae bacterium]|nr:pilus assembly protein [Hyphomicrobiaceae bacterium]
MSAILEDQAPQPAGSGEGGDLRSLITNFGRDKRGNIAMLFAMMITVAVSLVGGAVDYGRAIAARDKMQNALDSAVLAAARVWQTEGDINLAEAKAREFYKRMKPTSIESDIVAFNPDVVNNKIKIEVEGMVHTPFLSLVRSAGYTISSSAEALLAVGGNSEINLEISMMLDVTGSMSGQKIEDLKAAAKDLVDIVVWDDQSEYTSKVAIAPFAPRVNVGSFASAFTGLPATKTFSGKSRKLITCVTDRVGTHEYTDVAPGAGAYVSAYKGDTGSSASSNSSNYSSSGSCSDPGEQIMPLTSNKTDLKARIDSFSASGATAGALGTAWAWYMISPNWAHFWPEANRPVAYGT